MVPTLRNKRQNSAYLSWTGNTNRYCDLGWDSKDLDRQDKRTLRSPAPCASALTMHPQCESFYLHILAPKPVVEAGTLSPLSVTSVSSSCAPWSTPAPYFPCRPETPCAFFLFSAFQISPAQVPGVCLISVRASCISKVRTVWAPSFSA
jgi:hypothetical protein